MTDGQGEDQLLITGEAAACALELANSNIRKYLELHKDVGAVVVMNASESTAVAPSDTESTIEEAYKTARESAALAAKRLQEFLASNQELV